MPYCFDFKPSEWDELTEKCGFTDEEQEIIRLRRRGWKIADVAAELYLSDRTIKRRIGSIARKIINVCGA